MGQYDAGLPGSGYTCQQIQFPSLTLPAGDYRLMTTIYNWSTGARLPDTAPGQTTPQDRLPVGIFKVQ